MNDGQDGLLTKGQGRPICPAPKTTQNIERAARATEGDRAKGKRAPLYKGALDLDALDASAQTQRVSGAFNTARNESSEQTARVLVADCPCITAEWFAGFVDGEGSLLIAHHGGRWVQPRFSLNQRDDDGELVRAIHAWLGVGRLYEKRTEPHHKHWSPLCRPQRRIVVVGKHCARIVKLLDAAQLRSKKRYEYPVWRSAVLDYVANQCTRWTPSNVREDRDRRMLAFKAELEALRAYRGAT